MSRIVAISDFCTRVPPERSGSTGFVDISPFGMATDIGVRGGYLERLPLAAVGAGLVQTAEIWSFAGSDQDSVGLWPSAYGLGERRFRADAHPAPYGSRDMLAHLRKFGAPEILCVWGLGVTAETLLACADSIRIYNSIDVDALRIPVEVSRHIDIFLTGSESQSEEVRARHPEALVQVMPIGPEFASPDTFFPTGGAKQYDLVYVAAAQPYKRHDILFAALVDLPRAIRCLCVFGYGEQADNLRGQASDRGLNIDFVGPPGVPHDEVNRLINGARIGLVCGIDDGAPAILTEYMLAGLPVLANAKLRCGLQFIRPDTGRTAEPNEFARVIQDMLANLHSFSPREAVLSNWAWQHSVARLKDLVSQARARRHVSAAF